MSKWNCVLTSIVLLSTLLAASGQSARVQFPDTNAYGWSVTITYPDGGRTGRRDSGDMDEENEEKTEYEKEQSEVVGGSVVGSDNVEEQPKPLKMTCLKVGKRIQNRISWSNGKETESWILGELGCAVLENPLDGNIWVEPEVGFVSGFFCGPSRFAWTKGAPEPVPASFRGKPSMLYTRTWVPPMPAAHMKSEEKTYRAWVELETNLPLALDEAEAQYRFEFFTTDVFSLNMPPEFQRELDRYQKRISKPLAAPK